MSTHSCVFLLWFVYFRGLVLTFYFFWGELICPPFFSKSDSHQTVYIYHSKTDIEFHHTLDVNVLIHRK